MTGFLDGTAFSTHNTSLGVRRDAPGNCTRLDNDSLPPNDRSSIESRLPEFDHGVNPIRISIGFMCYERFDKFTRASISLHEDSLLN